MPLTCKVALAGVVLLIVSPPPMDVNAPTGIVLIRFPGVDDVTSTATVHEPGVDPVCMGTVPPLNDNTVAPGTALTEPPQVFDRFTGLAIKIPGWTALRLSVHLASVNAKVFGL